MRSWAWSLISHCLTVRPQTKHFMVWTLVYLLVKIMIELISKSYSGLLWWSSGEESIYQWRGHGLGSLVREDPTCQGAIKPVSHSSRAWEPQLLKPGCLEPMLRDRDTSAARSRHSATREQPPLGATREKPTCSDEDPVQPKTNT